MEVYQCLTIGINRYQYLRPLSYGIADCQALYQVLCQQINVPPQCICILSDPTYPSGRNILKTLNSLPPTSRLWFFFSGYALHHGGEDYLLPIDGNPTHPEKTGIKISTIFHGLQRTNAEHILVILDLHRVSFNSTPLGANAIALAKNLGLNLILSAALEPLSQKVSHPNGIFTTALTEALGHYQNQITLNLIEQYLQIRLPELNHIQGLNQQTPVIVAPSLKMRSQLLFVPFKREIIPQATIEAQEEAGGKAQRVTLTLPKLPTPPVEPPHIPAGPPPSPPVKVVKKTAPIARKPDDKSFEGLWWGVLTLLCASVFCWWWTHLVQGRLPDDRSFKATIPLSAQQASRFNDAIAGARKIKPDSDSYESAQAEIGRWSEVIVDIAHARAEKGDYEAAIASAVLVPQDQKKLYALSQEKIKIWTEARKREENNLVLLKAAQDLLKPGEPNSYLQGIKVLQQIPSESREYQKAKILMNRWSENIYVLARKQAKKRNFSRAIKTAQLIPPATSTYPKAQKSIIGWRKK
ncbi:MAG: hypothetical protein N5P05_003328 [Chroococcopsis gigantea SAG 12.99]|jgi:hypothetical protein|nr:caspase family protein [Chlorogloea purpurea SAG 13.99]MDV3001722.1 hypothetical protein [Chroococcopsis gigantea SAG 12.99]